jgi:polyhydroxyalkanoate synthesis regulator phasin
MGGRPKTLSKKPNANRTLTERKANQSQQEEEEDKEKEQEEDAKITLTDFLVTDLIIKNISEQNQLISHWAKKPKLNHDEAKRYLIEFLENKKIIEKPYKNLADLKSHISNWFDCHDFTEDKLKNSQKANSVEKYKLFKAAK